MVQARDSAGYSVVVQQAAHRVEHLLVMVAVALQPDTLGVPEGAHLLAMVAAKADRQQVTAAVAAAEHLQDMVVAAKADLPLVTVEVAAAEHLQARVLAAKVDLPQVTVAVAAAEHLQDMAVAAKGDLPLVTVAVAEAVHLQDMAAGVELALEVPVVPALEVEAQAQED